MNRKTDDIFHLQQIGGHHRQKSPAAFRRMLFPRQSLSQSNQCPTDNSDEALGRKSYLNLQVKSSRVRRPTKNPSKDTPHLIEVLKYIYCYCIGNGLSSRTRKVQAFFLLMPHQLFGMSRPEDSVHKRKEQVDSPTVIFFDERRHPFPPP